jgi:hypothetical protein
MNSQTPVVASNVDHSDPGADYPLRERLVHAATSGNSERGNTSVSLRLAASQA